MRPPAAAPLRHDPAHLARAFLALTEADPRPVAARHRATRAALALMAALVIALALPLLWAATAGDQPADRATATVPHKIALEPDDDDLAA